MTGTSLVTNTATKTAAVQIDLLPGNDSASVSVTGQAADIGVTKTVDRATPTVGQAATYTVVAHNFGPSTASGVQLRDVLPAGLTFVSYTATQGTYDWVTGRWDVGAIVNGGAASLSIVSSVATAGSILNTVIVLGGGYVDVNLTNDVASVGLVAKLPILPGLPGLPNTAGAPLPDAPDMARAIAVATLAVVAGLGVLFLAGTARRPRHARAGRRRSRSADHQSSERVAVGLLAVALSLALSSFSIGEPASVPSPGTQVIGGKVVSVDAPPAPKAEIVHQVAGAIFPSRLRIPSIGVDAAISAVGLRPDGSMDAPDNLWTSSWLATGPRPGQAGNAVIAGHRGVGTPALFSHFEKVQPGDRIYVSDGAGGELIYVVTRVASLDLSTSTQVAVFAPTATQHLVLVTCFGKYVESARTYDHRLVVFSEPLQ